MINIIQKTTSYIDVVLFLFKIFILLLDIFIVIIIR